jgi:hypothetical protein
MAAHKNANVETPQTSVEMLNANVETPQTSVEMLNAKERPKAGEIRPVTGGYGLMLVLGYDPKLDAAEMRGHGPAGKLGHWFPSSRLCEPVGLDVVLKERQEAAVRNVSCNNPDCWCRAYNTT